MLLKHIKLFTDVVLWHVACFDLIVVHLFSPPPTYRLQDVAANHIKTTSPPRSVESDADKGYESRTDSTFERPGATYRQSSSSSSGRPGPPTAPKTYKHSDSYPSGDVASGSKPPPPIRSYSNQIYMDPGEVHTAQNTSKDTYSSRDSGLPNSLERTR